jgi:hypothetical protein
MSFKLRIPGRDEVLAAPAANPANPLIEGASSCKFGPWSANDTMDPASTVEPISRLAGLAAPKVSKVDDEAMRERSAVISANGAPYWLADTLAGLQPWTDAEIATFLKRQARIVWLGYVAPSEYLAERLLHRDRDGDERRLCVECAHVRPGWRCARNAGFLLEQLQRCDHFMESTQ